ncbi:MAG: hypothetical protein KJ787_00265 [Gammaproteobacteria bacterium]|nr:hypothetical protein [Gammaproteobacteria bacterium]MBU1644750.1 hypothetical protein [Gammaproteobacteria bacterium]MBU1973484.1 hypothetical protein [Gammaproteobacteria bacterium]
MGNYSAWHGFSLIIPVIVIVVIVLVLRRTLRDKPENTPIMTPAVADPARPLPEGQTDKLKWLAGGGYMLVLADAFFTQLLGCYQFHLFGYLVCLLTLAPYLIFYFINRVHSQPLVVAHVLASMRLYLVYVGWSVLNGLLLSGIGTNLVYAAMGLGISLVMLGVLAWLSIRCGQGIIAAFRLALPVTRGAIATETPSA